LHLAIDPNILQLICERVPDPGFIDIVDNLGFSALMSHTSRGNVQCVKVLLLYGANTDLRDLCQLRNCYLIAANCGNFDMMSCLKLHSQTPIDTSSMDIDGNQAIHLLCDCHSSQSLQCLLSIVNEDCNSVNFKNFIGCTPLHLLCRNQHLKNVEPLIELFLEFSSNPNVIDNEGVTPLTVAVIYRKWGIVKILLEAGKCGFMYLNQV